MSPFAPAADLVPEAWLLLGALGCCGLAVAPRHRYRLGLVRAITAGSTVAAAASSVVYLRGLPREGYAAYAGGLVVDRYAIFLVPTVCAFCLFATLSGAAVAPRLRLHAGEYHALLLLATLGAALLASTREMIAFYVALELLSVSLYALVGMVKTERWSSEAAFKYLIIGAASSAVLLYGLALLYGLTQTTDLVAVGRALSQPRPAAVLGAGLVVVGLAFKLGAVPFHQWVPDVYQGAPAPVAGLIATMSKTAGFAVLARVAISGFGATTGNWTALVAAMAAASMLYGNLVALAQQDIKRLLAYSSIGQAGFVLLGLLAFPPADQGIAAMLFYLFTYGVTVAGIFAVVAYLDGLGLGSDLDAYRGLSRRSPEAAAVLAVGMVSLVGVPPLIGFFAKLFVFQAAVEAGYAWLVVLALAATVISAGYYLKVVRVAYVDPPPDGAASLPLPAATVRLSMAICGLATVFLGAAAQPLFALAAGAAGQVH